MTSVNGDTLPVFVEDSVACVVAELLVTLTLVPMIVFIVLLLLAGMGLKDEITEFTLFPVLSLAAQGGSEVLRDKEEFFVIMLSLVGESNAATSDRGPFDVIDFLLNNFELAGTEYDLSPNGLLAVIVGFVFRTALNGDGEGILSLRASSFSSSVTLPANALT